MSVLLLSTPACHLCELAQQVLQQAFLEPDVEKLSQAHSIEIYLQDIIDEPDLLETYGEKIPVLLDEETQLSLEWPFDAKEVMAWLQKVVASTGSKTA